MLFMLRLKIWDKGVHMEIEISFRSLVSPSRSRLCFAVKFWIVVCTVAGEVSPISR
jgi:hypothetical protein